MACGIVCALTEAPATTPDDLAERYRQLRIFDEAEIDLVDALLTHPDRLTRQDEHTLRLALNLARLWIVPEPDGPGFVVGPKLGQLRDKVRRLAQTVHGRPDADPAPLSRDARELAPVLREAKEQIVSAFSGRLLSSAFDAEVGTKKLVLVLGGGGGCGYVHLGVFSILERLGAIPKLIVGSSMGSVLGLFRSREQHYRDATVRAF